MPGAEHLATGGWTEAGPQSWGLLKKSEEKGRRQSRI